MTILSCPSPNHGPRRDGARPDMVVIHYTAMQDARA
ncbi:MAG TPA: N-acetylmuramoyl-L-alanine amidase, partial [Paracoccaceae bacterium]|nr:N-acetylmuramoyl-L-alanine amidase [Paracoccaceae bacterium]